MRLPAWRPAQHHGDTFDDQQCLLNALYSRRNVKGCKAAGGLVMKVANKSYIN